MGSAFRRFVLSFVVAAVAGCSTYPDDIEGTLDRIEKQHVIHVGLIAGLDPAARKPVQDYLMRVAHETGAIPKFSVGAAEPILSRIESGELDLVIGEVAKDSPWITEVALLDPLTERSVGARTIALTPIARNGENRWIMLLEKEARDTRGAQ